MENSLFQLLAQSPALRASGNLAGKSMTHSSFISVTVAVATSPELRIHYQVEVGVRAEIGVVFCSHSLTLTMGSQVQI